MAITTYEKRYENAFSFNAEFFRRLQTLLAQQNALGSFSVELSNSSRIDDLTLDELLALPNSRERQIKKISFDPNYKADPKVRIVLESGFGNTACRYSAVGNDKDASYISIELERLLNEARRPFGYFSAMHPRAQGSWWAALNFGGFVALVVVNAIRPSSSVWWALAFIFFFSQLAVTNNYGKIINWFAPPVQFEIGDGLDRSRTARSRQKALSSILFVVIGLGVVVSIVSSILYDKFIKAG